MKTLRHSLALLVVSASISISAQEVVYATALPRATMRELAARPFAEQPRRIVHHRVPQVGAKRFAATSIGETAAITPTIAPPPMAMVFDSDTSKGLTPPDATGAVGPLHVLSVSNARIIVHGRDGSVHTVVLQSQFWTANSPSGVYYDPRAAYDAEANRWVMMTIHDEEAMMIAVSETGDPNGAWHRYRVPAHNVDFSMLAMTADTILFGTLLWPSSNSLYASVRKEDLYALPSSVPITLYNATVNDSQPVTTDRTVQYVVGTRHDGILLQHLGHDEEIFIPQPAGWGTFTSSLPQFGSGVRLDSGYNTVQNAVERRGKVYVTLTRVVSGSSAIVWCKFDPETLEAEWGSLSDTQGRVFAYPSIAVNRSGAMLIGFGHFSATQYASSGYIYRDAFGRVSTVAPIRNGETAVSFDNRWGDYTTTLVDPLDDSSFWTTQLHAKDGTWATSWAKVEVPGRRRTVRR